MKHRCLVLALIIPVAIATSACAVLTGLEQFDTPAVAAAVLAVNADVVKLAKDTATATADRTADPAAVPDDLATLSGDATSLASDKAALLAAIATAKSAGMPVTAAALATAG